MSVAFYFLLVAIVLIAVVIAPAVKKRFLLNKAFPDAWQQILYKRLPIYHNLPPDTKQQLQQLVTLFLADKRFYGCSGLQINDEIRVTIAAEACLLILNRRTSLYSKLRSILVYPDAFVAKREQYDAAGVASNHPVGLLGESWDNGKIVLSWDDVERGVRDFDDGHNVVLHEFAHQLDCEAGGCNGTPLLKPSRYQSWARVLSTEFTALQYSATHHKRAVEDYYGATNPAEFFAVATETFFEKPQLMASKQPQLFAQLADYYCVDPRQWHD